MSKDSKRLAKAVDKFKKNAEKELDRARSLVRKTEPLKGGEQPSSAADRLRERLRQKELQASGEVAWAEQLLSELAAPGSKKDKSKKSAASEGSK
ncbi:MAG: hypothetical protein KGM42_04925 [Hyphomicrobiales bacterium]|nr:hypothetical protein [Hyphomicrobiales bacterium]